MAGPPYRLVISLLLFLNVVLCYLDRLNMAVCALPMAKEFGWSESVKVRGVRGVREALCDCLRRAARSGLISAEEC